MPRKTPEQRLATLEAQMQGLADDYARTMYGYAIEWEPAFEDEPAQWFVLSDKPVGNHEPWERLRRARSDLQTERNVWPPALSAPLRR